MYFNVIVYRMIYWMSFYKLTSQVQKRSTDVCVGANIFEHVNYQAHCVHLKADRFNWSVKSKDLCCSNRYATTVVVVTFWYAPPHFPVHKKGCTQMEYYVGMYTNRASVYICMCGVVEYRIPYNWQCYIGYLSNNIFLLIIWVSRNMWNVFWDWETNPLQNLLV